MRVLVFTEGTVIMHRGGLGRGREEIIRQVKEGEATVTDWSSYVPVGDAVKKLKTWENQGAEILYLTSRMAPEETATIAKVMAGYGFPAGPLLFRRPGEQYADVASRAAPDIIVEDDCESIGGEDEMVFPHLGPELKDRIVPVTVPEFGGIDHLPGELDALLAGES